MREQYTIQITWQDVDRFALSDRYLPMRDEYRKVKRKVRVIDDYVVDECDDNWTAGIATISGVKLPVVRHQNEDEWRIDDLLVRDFKDLGLM